MNRQHAILAALTLSTALIAAEMLRRHATTWLEAASFVTGALCVWLTVRESAWNFPISLVNVATFLFVFANARLFADAGLQVVYFVLTIMGWYLWLHGGEKRTELHVSRISRAKSTRVIATGILMTILLTWTLTKFGGAAPFWDALTTSLSLCAQWLLNRKHLENWYCWIAVDAIYIPLYAYKSLYLTSVLYGVFLCMAVIGLLAWRATWRRERGIDVEARGFEVVVPS